MKGTILACMMLYSCHYYHQTVALLFVRVHKGSCKYKRGQEHITPFKKETQNSSLKTVHICFLFLALSTLFLFKTRLFLISCSTGEFSFTLYRGKLELRVFFEKKKKKKGNRWRIVVSSSNKM